MIMIINDNYDNNNNYNDNDNHDYIIKANYQVVTCPEGKLKKQFPSKFVF